MISYDKKINHIFSQWLMICLWMILLMIIVGGLTRLTNSGLSITEWELFSGILPPVNNASWISYFESYKRIPQYNLLNSSMSLEEFKIIFYWEYIHRLLGRLIGLFFILPLLYFHFIKKIDFKILQPLYFVSLLILFQGLVGWYMVKSGLVNEVTVSHYRLSVHLSLAIIILSIIFWQLLNYQNQTRKSFFKISIKNLPYLILFFLIFLQIIIGAFVSGLDAGKIYQTWPLMGQKYFPDDTNFDNLLNFENHSLVQFYHRNLAYIVSIYIIILCLYLLKKVDKNLYKPILLIFITLAFQITLGISTLLSNLHIVIASAHQIFSVILVLSALNLYYCLIK